MATRTAIINVMAKACYKASRNLLRDFGEVEKLQVLFFSSTVQPFFKDVNKQIEEFLVFCQAGNNMMKYNGYR